MPGSVTRQAEQVEGPWNFSSGLRFLGRQMHLARKFQLQPLSNKEKLMRSRIRVPLQAVFLLGNYLCLDYTINNLIDKV